MHHSWPKCYIALLTVSKVSKESAGSVWLDKPAKLPNVVNIRRSDFFLSLQLSRKTRLFIIACILNFQALQTLKDSIQWKTKWRRNGKRRKDGYIGFGKKTENQYWENKKNYNAQAILHPFPSFPVPKIGSFFGAPMQRLCPEHYLPGLASLCR